jgi:hypothetical protein
MRRDPNRNWRPVYDERDHLPHDIFEPDVLLPVQFFARTGQRRQRLSGERRLLIAVMRDALKCFQRYLDARAPKTRALYAAAEAWIMTEGINGDDAFTFDELCDALGMSPAYTRAGLLAWRDAERIRRRAGVALDELDELPDDDDEVY